MLGNILSRGNIPQVTTVADSVFNGSKAIVEGGLGAAKALANGAKDIAAQTAQGFMTTVLADLDKAAFTIDSAANSLKGAADQVRSQVDRGVGQEVVQKFVNQIENLGR